MGKGEAKGESEGGRAGSGRWKQDSLGWSLIDESLLNPITQTLTKSLSKEVSVNRWQDNVAVEKPYFDNRQLSEIKNEHIRGDQIEIQKENRCREGTAITKRPDAVQSSTQLKPDLPSMSLKRPNKIRRKEVGSGLNQRKNSIEIVAAKCEAKHPSKAGAENNQIITSVSPQTSCFESSQYPDVSCEASKARQSSPRSVAGQTTNCLSCLAAQDSRALPMPPQQHPPKTLSSPLPYLHFLHSNNHTNFTYPARSYRRHQNLLPVQLRASGINSDIKGVYTGTANDSTSMTPDSGHRPQVQRKNGTTTVPKLLIRSMERKGEFSKQYCQPVIGREADTPELCIRMDTLRPKIDKFGISKGISVSDIEVANPRDQREKPISDNEEKKLEVKTLKLPTYICPGCNELTLKNSSNATLAPIKLSREGKNVSLELFREFHQGGSKLIQFDGTLDSTKNLEMLGVKMRAMTHDLRRRAHKTKQ